MNNNSNHQTWKEVEFVGKRLINTQFKDIYCVSETGSTNSDLISQANQGTKAGLVLVAEHQSEGRGRLDRLWEAPPKTNLLFSVLIQPRISPHNFQLLTPALALSLVYVLEHHQIQAEIKWPNDVCLKGEHSGKVAGILAESVRVDDASRMLVIGMGCNVAWPTSKDKLPFKAVSLKQAGLDIGNDDLLIEILLDFDTQIKKIENPKGLQSLRQELLGKSATVGKRVLVQQHSGDIEGKAIDLDSSGALIVNDGTKEHFIVAGDVVHLREI